MKFMDITVKVDKSLLTIAEELEDNLKDAIKQATLEVKEEVLDNIRRGYVKLNYPPISESYRKQLERKGLLPHEGLISPREDKKKLEKSISHSFRRGGLEGVIKTSRPYAIFVEQGTKKMPARPFFQPALKAKKERVEELIKKAIEDALD
ncbi:phage protein, HK97 gp10 family [Methanocaldococcus vulcanius M7]|uniref:Phage protein, HK97 gp10 family n=1 Tax=Methanocaldococcus vulcanius (strain ATCC 700851 / DSM 12094 / M7) TaxID=579137 RepID=C9RFS1_METVM|nr:HK97-gp10 family putative phage morphogenesis protein [Methanocaldococcus vulcanius]ACX72423.1 phage protein, HK97 gp10 family [Methanocaldococcus vulcanius M7]